MDKQSWNLLWASSWIVILSWIFYAAVAGTACMCTLRALTKYDQFAQKSCNGQKHEKSLGYLFICELLKVMMSSHLTEPPLNLELVWRISKSKIYFSEYKFIKCTGHHVSCKTTMLMVELQQYSLTFFFFQVACKWRYFVVDLLSKRGDKREEQNKLKLCVSL